MAGEWRKASIEEVAERVAMGPFGSSIKVETFVPYGVPVISGQHLHGSKVDDRVGFNFVSEEHADRLKNANVQRGDVVFTHAGNIGQVALIPPSSEFERYVISQRQFYMRCNRAKVLPEFVVAYFKTPEGRHKLLANTSQVGVPSIAQPVTYLRTIEIPLPSISEQRAIAHILGTLDDKIELNRRMSATLEAMARALFKSWFVDFDPVRAKMEGRDPGLPQALADLFPARLVDSELGEIPEGWGAKPIGGLAEIVGGSTPKTERAEYWEGGTHHWVTPKDLSGLSMPVLLNTERKITDAGLAQVSSGLLPAGTVLLSSRAPIGYLAIAEMPVAINQGFIGMKPRPGISNLFLLRWAAAAHDEIVSYANGSTFLEISKSAFRPILAVAPPTSIMDAFDRLSRPMYRKVVEHERESRTLAALRDTLLPKLISGELRVTEAEAFLKARDP
ncbi:MAG: restriction endonuclease subunit S [Pseudomonadota bacterium]